MNGATLLTQCFFKKRSRPGCCDEIQQKGYGRTFIEEYELSMYLANHLCNEKLQVACKERFLKSSFCDAQNNK
jgi:hypothetical protein